MLEGLVNCPALVLGDGRRVRDGGDELVLVRHVDLAVAREAGVEDRESCQQVVQDGGRGSSVHLVIVARGGEG